jgi:hypothetical protein
MTVGVNQVGLNLAFVLHQAVENIDRLSNAAGNKVRKQRDVFCADDKVRLSEGLRYAKEIEISSSLQASIKRSSP